MTSRPAAHDAPMLPPIFSTKSLAMESPNPAEPRAFSTVKKRSNRRFALTSSSEDAAFSKVSVFLHRDAEVAVGVAHRIGYDVAEHPRERVFVGNANHFILRDIDGGRNAALLERGIKLRERIFERRGDSEALAHAEGEIARLLFARIHKPYIFQHGRDDLFVRAERSAAHP